jgi:hypothetical protein
MGVGGVFPYLSRKSSDIILSFETLYLCETGFSTVTGNRTMQLSVKNLEDDLREVI